MQMSQTTDSLECNSAVEEIRPKPLCVLVVDDDPDMLKEIARGLRARGCAAITVASGEQIIDYVGKTVSFGGRFLAPDVIIADIRMPGCSGFGLLEALHDAQCDTPVILMTAFGDQETHKKARRLGAVATFDKPFDADDLSTAVLWACNPGAAYSLYEAPEWQRRRHQSRLGFGEGLRDRDREGADHGLGSDESEVERQTDLNVVHLPRTHSKREVK